MSTPSNVDVLKKTKLLPLQKPTYLQSINVQL